MAAFTAAYGVLGLGSLAGCTGNFCAGTVDYMVQNAEYLTSFGSFFELFPWGWAVQFGRETFVDEDGMKIAAAYNYCLAYVYFWVWVLLLHPDAVRRGKMKFFALLVTAGTFACFGTVVPVYFAWRTRKTGFTEWEKYPLEYGKSGYVIVCGIGVTVIVLPIMLLMGYSAGHDGVLLSLETSAMACGAAMLCQALGAPLAYAVATFKERNSAPQSVLRAQLLRRIVEGLLVVYVGVMLMSYYEMWHSPSGTYFAKSTSTLFSWVFFADSLSVRGTGILFLIQQKELTLAALDFFIAPVGSMMYVRKLLILTAEVTSARCDIKEVQLTPVPSTAALLSS